MKKAIVLLSGGQDSTTCLYWARNYFAEVETIGIFYGQRHRRELEAAQKIARKAGVSFQCLNADILGTLGDSALVKSGANLTMAGGRLDSQAPNGLPSSFVPGRNALFLVIAGAFAVRANAKHIVTGTCQTDYSGYPDCRREFIDAQERALNLAMPSSAGPLHIHTPLMCLTKAETVKLARTFAGCWEALAESLTCYEGLRPGCGICPACVLRARGFAEAGEIDPATLSN